ncbi:phosphate/phosphite/phosphonate ABC transporter substrate-binding protein [Tabrizicola oligotrophica]|uniref:PhnD/SsuA/transferrin family substrate-binding protein n=1 Tax=Tabrizicola oligotrophica TaxID=2710650 RepID=A0A6M0QXF1_9RHOB|nr:PhnD/SsuA/transferrin family substrate-binding protein [Tabrizicola oligotrophica]NEY92178.1 PhnD/SsuA/transferrin family substrate-binding protein [Tabrizicola oligotrophica]
MIASLGMYDRAETMAANDRLWALVREGLRARGLAAPEALTRGAGAYWQAWEDPTLVLSQTCGFPYRARLHDKVALVASPDYGLPDCPPGYYCSVFVARADDARTLPEFRAARFAFNEGLSQSGWAAPQNHAASMGFHFAASLETGSHRGSALAVAEGRADLACLDALTWTMLQRWEPAVAGLREVARTAPTPALPYIAAKGADTGATFAALADAVAALSPGERETLSLRGVVRIAAERYLAVPIPPSPEQIAQSG